MVAGNKGGSTLDTRSIMHIPQDPGTKWKLKLAFEWFFLMDFGQFQYLQKKRPQNHVPLLIDPGT